MKCAICIYLSVTNGLLEATSATTTVAGTALCDEHAVEKMENLTVLQDLGLR